MNKDAVIIICGTLASFACSMGAIALWTVYDMTMVGHPHVAFFKGVAMCLAIVGALGAVAMVLGAAIVTIVTMINDDVNEIDRLSKGGS